MARTLLCANNVLLLLLEHMRILRENAGEPKIITADLDIWQRAVFALREHCDSLLLHVFDFRRYGLRFSSPNLEQTFRNLSATGLISTVPVEYDGYHTIAYILRDELTFASYSMEVDYTKNPLACYVSDITTDPSLSEDAQVMRDETRKLAAQLLPMLDERVAVEIKTHSNQGDDRSNE